MQIDAVNQGECGLLGNAQRGPRVVAAHGFITAPDILALLCQLDADAVLDSLSGPDSPAVPTSVVVPSDRYDRRAARRVARKDLRPDVQLTLRGGSRIELVNISETGVLVETPTHGIIGAVVDLFISVDQRWQIVRATTVRSTLVAIQSGSAVYRTAFHFEEPLSLRNLLRK